MKKKICKSLLSVGFLLGCSSLSIKKEITKNYYLVAPDDASQLALCYHVRADENNYPIVIDPQITALGFNKNFLIAKQKMVDASTGIIADKENYFILPLRDTMDWSTKNGLMGPLSLDQFERKMDSLGLSQVLKFTKRF